MYTYNCYSIKLPEKYCKNVNILSEGFLSRKLQFIKFYHSLAAIIYYSMQLVYSLNTYLYIESLSKIITVENQTSTSIVVCSVA